MASERPRPARLGDLISIKHGWPFKSDLYSTQLTGRPIVVSVGNFQYTGGFRFETTSVNEYRGEYPREYELTAGDTLLIMTCQTSGGEILGIPARVPDDGRVYLHNQRLGKVVLKRPDLVDPRYLYWVFLSKPFNQELCASATGTKIVHTAPTRIEAYEFALPPLPEQRAIAGVLGALDDKIEVNRKTARVLEGIARAVFTSWFVDFDPVRANIRRREHAALGRAGRFISTGDDISISDPSGKVIHRAGDAAQGPIAHLFPDRLVDSAIGEVPEGWRVGTLGEVIEAVGGGTPSTGEPSYWDGGTHAFCTPKDMSALTAPVLLTTERRVTDAGLGKINSGLLPSGTVVMSSRAPIGYLAITEIPVAVNQGIIAMRCTRGWPASFVLRWCEAHMDQIEANANGSTFQEISKTNFRPIAAVLPDPAVVSAFDRVAAPLHRRVVACERQSATLAALRDALLPKLISGELRIADAERIVGRAL